MCDVSLLVFALIILLSATNIFDMKTDMYLRQLRYNYTIFSIILNVYITIYYVCVLLLVSMQVTSQAAFSSVSVSFGYRLFSSIFLLRPHFLLHN